MPVINKRQIERMLPCVSHSPQKFIRILNKYQYNPIALRDAGIAYATEQIGFNHLRGGGIHLYTMNNTIIADSITNNIVS